jgi:8-oxo-dGTP pyrophosphatase MutT (NUDIX family)
VRSSPDEQRPADVSAPRGATPWERVGGERLDDLLLFRRRHDLMRSPRTGAVLERLVLEAPDWVNVVALTSDEQLVCVRQYRFGTAELELEIPAGIVEEGEDHRVAAERELREETGYEAAEWAYLGACAPNPAFLDNRCHHWLARGAIEVGAQALDPGEDIEVRRVALADVPGLVANGELRHALVVSALARVVDLSRPG